MCLERNSPIQIPHALCTRRPRSSLSIRPSWPFGDGESHPFWLHSGEKGGFAILKRHERNCAIPWLGEWLVLWSGTFSGKASSTKGTASCGVTPGSAHGRLRPWGLSACDKCSRKYNGLAWSGQTRIEAGNTGRSQTGLHFNRIQANSQKTVC